MADSVKMAVIGIQNVNNGKKLNTLQCKCLIFICIQVYQIIDGVHKAMIFFVNPLTMLNSTQSVCESADTAETQNEAGRMTFLTPLF